MFDRFAFKRDGHASDEVQRDMNQVQNLREAAEQYERNAEQARQKVYKHLRRNKRDHTFSEVKEMQKIWRKK